MTHRIPFEITEKLTANPIIKRQLRSVIWFGSIRNNQDVHERSDYDIQLIFDKPSEKLNLAINEILQSYPFVDLSIMYMQDIYNKEGNVIFHDGTKGLFFMYVLAEGKIIYGEDVYSTIVQSLDFKVARGSILITIREYLSRLRVMAAFSPNDTMQFKKYSLKMFKDIIVYLEKIDIQKISKLSNNDAQKMISELHVFSDSSKKALNSITDYERNFTKEELASLLHDYEEIVYGIIND